jgi:hypothetical protein
MIKSRRMRWTRHVARVDDVIYVCAKFKSVNLKGKDYMGDLDVDGRLILKEM